MFLIIVNCCSDSKHLLRWRTTYSKIWSDREVRYSSKTVRSEMPGDNLPSKRFLTQITYINIAFTIIMQSKLKCSVNMHRAVNAWLQINAQERSERLHLAKTETLPQCVYVAIYLDESNLFAHNFRWKLASAICLNVRNKKNGHVIS